MGSHFNGPFLRVNNAATAKKPNHGMTQHLSIFSLTNRCPIITPIKTQSKTKPKSDVYCNKYETERAKKKNESMFWYCGINLAVNAADWAEAGRVQGAPQVAATAESARRRNPQ